MLSEREKYQRQKPNNAQTSLFVTSKLGLGRVAPSILNLSSPSIFIHFNRYLRTT